MGLMFALLSGLGYTSSVVLNRRGLMEENPGNVWEINFVVMLTALVVFLMGICLATLFGFEIIQEFNYLNPIAVFLLIIEGALGPLIGGFFTTTAVAQIGASHASALRGGSNPLFATLFAIVILGENPGLPGIIAVLMIVGGILIVGYRGHVGTIALLEKTKIAGGIFALLAGLLYALSHIARGGQL